LHHQKKGLLERIGNGSDLVQQLIKAFFDNLRQSCWMKHGSGDFDSTPTQPSTRLRVLHQVL
jgi:hypothetical protein